MIAPFKLPVVTDGVAVYDADGGTPVSFIAAGPTAKGYIVKAINYHDRMAAAIARLLKAERMCQIQSDFVDVRDFIKARTEAFEELQQIHRELNP